MGNKEPAEGLDRPVPMAARGTILSARWGLARLYPKPTAYAVG